MEENKLTLRLVTPTGALPDIRCTSVTIPLADEDGVPGSAGIRYGHIAARFAICRGAVVAKNDGNVLAKINVGEGFAAVERNVVTVITSEFEKAGSEP